MDWFSEAVTGYEQAVGNGQPAELFATADELFAVGASAVHPEKSIELKALALHLRGVACLSTDDDPLLEQCLSEARALAQEITSPIVQAVHAILTFCGYYTSGEAKRIEEALCLFAARAGNCGIARLETASAINEIRTHSLALANGVPGYSPNRVEDLTARLLSNPLAPRLEGIVADTLATFYRRLAVVYGDTRFLFQGIALLAPIVTQNVDGPVADAALGAAWLLLASGLEYDAKFPIPREILARSIVRVRQHRGTGLPPDREVAGIAVGLGLRARFDWERLGKRTGLLRALGYLRIAALQRTHAVPYATTLRVAFEAGLGDRYLQQSLKVFEELRAQPGFRADPAEDSNFASTLMLLGNASREPERLARAIELYEGAIARDPDSAVNVSRFINLASAVQSYVRLSASRPVVETTVGELLMRGLDAVISMEVLDPPGSTHAGAHHAIASSYYSLFDARLGDRADALILARILDLFEGKELRWPIGFARYLARRVVIACEKGEPDLDLLSRCADALERVKLLLQVIDLCDGGNTLSEEIDGMFAAAVEMLRRFMADDRDADGLRVVDRLTAGFVSHAASGKAVLGDARVSDILQRAISGGALSADDIARIRLSPLSPVDRNDVAHEIADQPQLLRLDLLRAGGSILALRRGADGLAARLLSARKANPALVATLADFILDEVGTPWVGFRNLEPGAAHELFNALRAEVESRGTGRRVLRHGMRSLSEPITEMPWDQGGALPRIVVAHSPSNGAKPLSFGSTLTARLRELGAPVVELAFNECRRDTIVANLPNADVLLILSHGERGTSDRILLAGDDYLDAQWLLGLGDRLSGKCLFLIACNSGHFNARLTHDDVGLAALALALGARGAFSTLRSVDELSISLLVLAAIERWRSGAHLSLAFDDARAAMTKFAEQDWGKAIFDFVRGVAGAEDLARIPLDSLNQTRVASDRADVDVGWSFVLG